MQKITQPFSSFGASAGLLEALAAVNDPELAEVLAPRRLMACVEIKLNQVNVFFDLGHQSCFRVDGTHLGMAEDGILGLACKLSPCGTELFVPIDRFACWHAEVPRTWDGAHPSEGNAASLRFVLREEMVELARLMASPEPLACDIATQDLLSNMEPYPVAGDLGVACEQVIHEIYEGIPFPIRLTMTGVEGPVVHVGYITSTHRAYDGRLGFSFETDDGHQPMPFESVIHWALVDQDLGPDEWWDELPKAGGRAELEGIFESDLESMAGEYPKYIEENHWRPQVSWNDCIEPTRLSRLAPSREDRDWADGPETRIYLAMAQTLPEGVASVAIRVGGALWAEMRGDNAERVAWARRFVGFPVSDDMLVSAAASLDAAESARVQAAALFVACGGGTATPETLRRLTLLQTNCPVPRFW